MGIDEYSDEDVDLTSEQEAALVLEKSSQNMAETASLLVTMLKVVAALSNTSDLAEACSSVSILIPELFDTLQN